mmetsp:Transcript_12376/g.27771  ORF Transcript_12376/g.27771 Transcript_12376/m.27771 type:complete len:243 (+) Transcript_12376:116-844(+)
MARSGGLCEICSDSEEELTGDPWQPSIPIEPISEISIEGRYTKEQLQEILNTKCWQDEAQDAANSNKDASIRKFWSHEEEAELADLVSEYTRNGVVSWGDICRQLGRSISSCQTKWSRLGHSGHSGYRGSERQVRNRRDAPATSVPPLAQRAASQRVSMSGQMQMQTQTHSAGGQVQMQTKEWWMVLSIRLTRTPRRRQRGSRQRESRQRKWISALPTQAGRTPPTSRWPPVNPPTRTSGSK